MLSHIYNTGTVDVVEDYTEVLGTGVKWYDVEPGDEFRIGTNAAPIASISEDKTALVLAIGWPGSTASGSSYIIHKRSARRLAASASPSVAAFIAHFRDFITQIRQPGHILSTADTPSDGAGEHGQWAVKRSEDSLQIWRKANSRWVDQYHSSRVLPANGGFKVGRYIAPFFGGAPSTTFVAADTLYWFPFQIASRTGIDKVACEVVDADTATLARFALYDAVDGKPHALVQDFGTASVASPGLAGATFSVVTVEPGAYWLSVQFDGECEIRASAPAEFQLWPYYGVSGFNSFLSPTNAAHQLIAADYPFGAFPSFAPTLSYVDDLNPIVLPRAALFGSWTPLSFGDDLAWWFDPEENAYVDAGSTLAADGQAVQQWTDRSPNAYVVSQATSGKRPTYDTTGINGRPAMLCTSAADTMLKSGTNAVALGGTAASVFLVGILNSGGDTYSRAVSFHGGGGQDHDNDASFLISKNISNQELLWHRNGNDSIRAITFGTPFRAGWVMDGANGVSYLNGVASSPHSQSGTFGSTGTLRISDSTQEGTEVWNGALGDSFCVKRVVTADELLLIDNFFTTKYGL